MEAQGAKANFSVATNLRKIEEEDGHSFDADFPPGPLDLYRKRAFFDWKVIRFIMEDEKVFRFKHKIWRTMERDPLFSHSQVQPTLDEQRELATARALRILEYSFLPSGTLKDDPRLYHAVIAAVGQYNLSLELKRTVLRDFTVNSIREPVLLLDITISLKRLSMSRLVVLFVDYISFWGFCAIILGFFAMGEVGCVAVTEIGHGKKKRVMMTRAVDDPTTQCFVLNTPDFETAKCWAGNLVSWYSQFFGAYKRPQDDVALHRDYYWGLSEKIGLNGLDNGYNIYASSSLNGCVEQKYRWLVCWLLQTTAAKYHGIMQVGKDPFTAKNESQVYNARTLSLVYIEHHAFERFSNFVDLGHPPQITAVLRKLLLLYGLWSLEKHCGTLYQGGYFSGPMPCTLIRDGILDLCTAIKDDSVALVDAIAPPDFILNSILGHSNGEVYKNLQASMSQCPQGLERPSWWKMITERLSYIVLMPS